MKTLLLLATTLLVVGCTTHSQSDYARQNGEKLLMDSGSYSALVTRYQTELQTDADPETRQKLANVHYLMGDSEAAMFQLSQIPPHEQNTPELALLRANVFFDQGKMSTAEQFANAALRMDDELGEAYNLKGLILADKGQIAEAKSVFEAARRFNFDDATVKNNLAMIALLQGDFDQAIDILMPLVQSGRADDTAKANLVMAFAKAGRTRAFSQMLTGSENDMYLAEKFQSLHGAQVHHSQLSPTVTLPKVPKSASELTADAVTRSSVTKPLSENKRHSDAKTATKAKPVHIEQAKAPVVAASPDNVAASKVAGLPAKLSMANATLSNSHTDKIANITPVKAEDVDPIALARERVKAANEKAAAKQAADVAAAEKVAAAKKAKEMKLAKAKQNKASTQKRSRQLITALQYQPVTTNGSANAQYVATADFELGKVRTMFLEDRNKWVFDVRGAKDFTTKRKQYLEQGPAKMIELGEHKNYVRIVLTLRDNAKGKPVVVVEGNTLTIRWEA